MSVIEEPLQRDPSLDEPMVAHALATDVFADADPLMALCGKRLLGVRVNGGIDLCGRCIELLREEYGDIEIGEQGWRPA